MRLLLFTILLLLTGLLAAQRTAVDFSAGVDYTYRKLTSGADSPDRTTTAIAIYDSLEHGSINGHLGLHLNRQIGQATQLRAGLRFSSLGVRMENSELRWGSQHDGDGGFDPNKPSGEPDHQSLRRIDPYFLDLPVLIRHQFGTTAWAPYLEAGLLPGVYLTSRRRNGSGNDATVTYRDDTQYGTNRFHLGASLAVGFSHSLSERFVLFLQPVFRYQVTPFADGPIRERKFSGGLEMGVRRHLKM